MSLLFVGLCFIVCARSCEPVDKIRHDIETLHTLHMSVLELFGQHAKALHLNILEHIKQEAVCWLCVSSQPFMETTRARQNSSNKYSCIIRHYSPTLIWYTRDSKYFCSSFVPSSAKCLLRICSNTYFVLDWKFLNTWSINLNVKFNLGLYL
jgi:hypothetical protein